MQLCGVMITWSAVYEFLHICTSLILMAYACRKSFSMWQEALYIPSSDYSAHSSPYNDMFLFLINHCPIFEPYPEAELFWTEGNYDSVKKGTCCSMDSCTHSSQEMNNMHNTLPVILQYGLAYWWLWYYKLPSPFANLHPRFLRYKK